MNVITNNKIQEGNKARTVIKLNKCHFFIQIKEMMVTQYSTYSASNVFKNQNETVYDDVHIFMAKTLDEKHGGLFREESKQNELMWRKFVTTDEMEILAIQVCDPQEEGPKFTLFLILNYNNNSQPNNLFKSFFKYFFPSTTRRNHSSVNRDEEFKKYKIICAEMAKQNENVASFLKIFGKLHNTQKIIMDSFIKSLTKEEDNTMAKFKSLVTPLKLFGKQLEIFATTKIPSDKEFLADDEENQIDDFDSVRDSELERLTQWLNMYENTAITDSIVDTETFKSKLRSRFKTADNFLKEPTVIKRLKNIQKRLNNTRATKSKIIDGTTISYFDSDKNLISENTSKKSFEVINNRRDHDQKNKKQNTKTLTEINEDKGEKMLLDKKVMVEIFSLGLAADKFKNEISHIFMDSTSLNEYMIVGISALEELENVDSQGIPFYKYRTCFIFLVESNNDYFEFDGERQKYKVKGTSNFYKEILSFVKNSCPNIKSITTDFEPAILNAIDHHKLMRWGCDFHYKQALRRNCVDKNVSREFLDVLDILPLVKFDTQREKLKTMNDISKMIKHEPDMLMWEYCAKQYINKSETMFNKNMINENDKGKYCEYFKFTDNTSERLFAELKRIHYAKTKLRKLKKLKELTDEEILNKLTPSEEGQIQSREMTEDQMIKKKKFELKQTRLDNANKRKRENCVDTIIMYLKKSLTDQNYVGRWKKKTKKNLNNFTYSKVGVLFELVNNKDHNGETEFKKRLQKYQNATQNGNLHKLKLKKVDKENSNSSFIFHLKDDRKILIHLPTEPISNILTFKKKIEQTTKKDQRKTSQDQNSRPRQRQKSPHEFTLCNESVNEDYSDEISSSYYLATTQTHSYSPRLRKRKISSVAFKINNLLHSIDDISFKSLKRVKNVMGKQMIASEKEKKALRESLEKEAKEREHQLKCKLEKQEREAKERERQLQLQIVAMREQLAEFLKCNNENKASISTTITK